MFSVWPNVSCILNLENSSFSIFMLSRPLCCRGFLCKTLTAMDGPKLFMSAGVIVHRFTVKENRGNIFPSDFGINIGIFQQTIKFKFHPLPLPDPPMDPRQCRSWPFCIFVSSQHLEPASQCIILGSAWHCKDRPSYLWRQLCARDYTSANTCTSLPAPST